MDMTGSLNEVDGKAYGTFSSLNFVNGESLESTVGIINTFLLGFKMNLASVGLVTAANTLVENLPVPMPNFFNLDYEDMDLAVENTYMTMRAKASLIK